MAPSTRPTQALVNLNTQAHLKHRQFAVNERNRVISHNDAALFEIKESRWNVSFPREVRPSTRPLCSVCVPVFGSKEKEEDYNSYQMIDATKTSRKPFWGVFSSFIESLSIPISPHIIEDHLILEDERVINACQSYGNDCKSAVLCLLKILKNRFSNLKCRLIFWLLCLFLRSNFRALCISKGQIQMLRKASKKCNLVFFPLHRSSLDLPVLAYTLAKYELSLPVSTIEEPVDSPALRHAMKGLGHVSMEKWKTEADQLYRAVNEAYLSHIWGSGSDAVIFPEGKINKTGKPYVGRGNAVYFFSKCYQDKMIQDAQVVPVSITYDKTIDCYLKGKSVCRLLFEMLFNRPQGGLVRVNFGRPFSFHDIMKKFERSAACEEQMYMSVSSMALNEYKDGVERNSYTTHSLLRHLLYDCSKLSPVMATQAIAFLLLYVADRQSEIPMSKLVSSLDDLRVDLTSRSVDTGFTGPSDNVVPYAVRLIGPKLIEIEERPEDTFLTPTRSLPDLLALSRLANGVILHFCLEGVVGRVLNSKLSEPMMTNVKIVDTAYELCEILEFEFVFTPSCMLLNDLIYQTFDDFVTSGILSRVGFAVPLRRLAHIEMSDDESVGMDDDDYGVEPQTVSYAVQLGHPKLKMYSGLLKPIIDVYACTVEYLCTIDDSDGLLEEELVKEVLFSARATIQKEIPFQAESLLEETVINCLRLLEKWRVVDVVAENGLKLYFFTSAFSDCKSRQIICEKINKFT